MKSWVWHFSSCLNIAAIKSKLSVKMYLGTYGPWSWNLGLLHKVAEGEWTCPLSVYRKIRPLCTYHCSIYGPKTAPRIHTKMQKMLTNYIYCQFRTQRINVHSCLSRQNDDRLILLRRAKVCPLLPCAIIKYDTPGMKALFALTEVNAVTACITQ